MLTLRTSHLLGFCCLVAIMYVLRLEADSIASFFGIYWSDEGAYLLSAKHAVLFGSPHPTPHDAYHPEFTAPLLYRYGLLTITEWNTVFFVRLGMALMVVAGIAIIARLARHQNRGDEKAELYCFAILLITPIVFFYARTGLSEGIQFLLMAVNLWVMHRLWSAAQPRILYAYAGLSAALIAIILLSKITSLGVCIGLTTGTIATLFLHPTGKPYRWKALLCAGVGGVVALGILYLWWIQGHEAQWISNNFSGNAYAVTLPDNPLHALSRFAHHFVALQYFLTLMPVLVIGLIGLIIAADRNNGFLWLLWIVTVTTLVAESFLGASIRRSFFELCLLMTLGGFTLQQYLASGLPKTRAPERIVSWVIVLFFILGAVYFVTDTLRAMDRVYMIAAGAWLSILYLALFSRPSHRAIRRAVVACVVLLALLPMGYQSLIAPYTLKHSAAVIEKHTPSNAVITGFITPWTYLHLKRQILFTNCPIIGYDMANDFADLPSDKPYYFLSIWDGTMITRDCVPANFDAYRKIGDLTVFYPFNAGPGGGGMKHLQVYMPMRLFAAPNAMAK